MPNGFLGLSLFLGLFKNLICTWHSNLQTVQSCARVVIHFFTFCCIQAIVFCVDLSKKRRHIGIAFSFRPGLSARKFVISSILFIKVLNYISYDNTDKMMQNIFDQCLICRSFAPLCVVNLTQYPRGAQVFNETPIQFYILTEAHHCVYLSITSLR